MSSLDKIKSTFQKHGHNPRSMMRRTQFDFFLNSLLSGDIYSPEVASELWQQASENKSEVLVSQLCATIVQAQNIVQDKLFELSDDLKTMQEEANNPSQSRNSRRISQLLVDIQEKQEQKRSFQDDLMLLTQPFGISMVAFMANAARTRKTSGRVNDSFAYNADIKPESAQLELKWLFYLCLAFALIEIIVIYKKYDFLNLMVLACLMSIFLMNQLDSIYLKFTLALLAVSQILDVIWLFMNASDYWNPPKQGTSAGKQSTYLKFIIILTFLGVFLKIPLGVFLYHYRHIDQSRQYQLDIGIAKIQLTPNKVNPISQTIKKMQILNN